MKKIELAEYLLESFYCKWGLSGVLVDSEYQTISKNLLLNSILQPIFETVDISLDEWLKVLANSFHHMKEPTIIEGKLTLRPSFIFAPLIVKNKDYYLLAGPFIDEESRRVIENAIGNPWCSLFKKIPNTPKDQQQQMLEDIKKIFFIITNLFPQADINDDLSENKDIDSARSKTKSTIYNGEHFYKSPLSKRELEVYELIMEGLSNSEISNTLHLSESTVKSHISNIFRKLHIKSRKELLKHQKDYKIYQ